MSVVVVIILHKFLILDVSILLLDGIKLISERKVVLVSLLDFKDLSLELGDEKILLIAGKMDGIVVLKKYRMKRVENYLL